MLLQLYQNLSQGSKGEARLFSVVSSEKMRQQEQTEIQEVLFKCKKKYFCCEDGQILKQVVWRCCGFSVFGDIQNSAGHDLEHPVVVDPDSSTRLELDYLQRSLQCQLFSDSVTCMQGRRAVWKW